MKEQKSVALVNETNAVKCSAFTLAEVLITLAVVGVVAAMTLPTLISKVNDKVTENQMSVFKAKMIKGLNLTKTAGDLNNTYENTYDFLVNGLGKNLKMASICDSEHLRDCIPYESIKYEKKDGSEASVSVSDLKTAKKLNLEGGFEDVAAFVLADGTPVLISYDKTCEVDTEELDKTISSCVAGLYDINGSRKPNKFLNKTETVNGKTISYSADLKTFNGAGIDSSTCLGKVGSLCITKSVAFPKDVWQDYFDEMPKCRHSSGQQYNNYFLIAQKYCEGKGKLPSASDLAKIATALYGETIGDEETIYRDSTVRAISISSENKNAVYSALGIEANPTNSGFGLWSDRETPDHDGAYLRAFYNDYTIYIGNVCGAEFMRAVCLEE